MAFYLTAHTICQGLFLLCIFILRAVRLSSKLLGQGYVRERLRSSLRKFYGRYGDLIKHYEGSLSRMLHDIQGHDHIQRHPHLTRHNTNFVNLLPNWTLLPILTLIPNFRRFPWNIVTGAASEQRTLTTPDTLSCPV